MRLFIKNMVCNRCKIVVESTLNQRGYPPLSISLGEAVLATEPSTEDLVLIKNDLDKLGFELLDDRRQQLIEKIKTEIIQLVHYSQSFEKRENLSDYLTKLLQKDYSSLSNLFSDVEGMTIEHFFILQKIERVKELLVYDEFSLSEIADQLQYSSVAHLSNQFKKITGLTPSHFKKIGAEKRKSLDEIV